MPAEFTTDADRLRRFAQEARAACALNHPNIITIHEIGETETENGSLHYIVTEYVEGETLRQRMASAPQRRMKPSEAIEVAAQIAAALSAAHEAGITHRDIKPENVMVRRDGIVKVLDFGLAKLTEPALPVIDSQAPTLARNDTDAGVVMGTPRYMSPEQARGEKVDARSDIFSLGVMLYEMITGRAPFVGATQGEVIAAILRDSPPPLAESAPGAPPEMERILDNALRKDRDERYQTVKELLGDLKDLTEERAFESRLERSLVVISNEQEAGEGSQVRRKPCQELLRRYAAVAINLALHGQQRKPWREFLRRHKVAVVAMSVVLSLGIARGIAWLVAYKSYPPHPNPAQMRLPHFEAVREQGFSAISNARFSPDGQLVAYAHTGDGQNIWVKQVNGRHPHRVTSGQWRDFSPIWSPDGQQLAFVSNRGNQIGVWTVPFLGGPVELVKVLGDDTMDIKGGPIWLKAWSKDKRKLYYEWNHNLYCIDMRTAEKEITQLTRFDSRSQKPHQICLSPDEKWIAYQGQDLKLWRMALGADSPVRVTNDLDEQVEESNPIWHADDKHLIYNLVRQDHTQIFITDISNGTSARWILNEYDGAVSDLSFDGAKLLCYGQRKDFLVAAVTVETGAERQVTDEFGVEFWPNVSPQGTAIAFQAIRGERFNWDPRKSLLMIQSSTAGQKPTLLTEDAFATQWSPDGEKIAFLRRGNKSNSLWQVPVAGGAARVVSDDGVIYGGRTGDAHLNLLQTAEFNWALDSSRIAFCSKKDGIPNVWISDSDGAQQRKVSANSDAELTVNSPLWSLDGRRVAYIVSPNLALPRSGQDMWGLWVWSEEGVASIYQSDSVMRLLGWISANELLVALIANADLNRILPTKARIVKISSLSGQPQLIATLQDAYWASLRLSPDRRNISFVLSQESGENIRNLRLSDGWLRNVTDNRDKQVHYGGLVWAPNGETIYFHKQTQWSVLTLFENINNERK